MPRHFFALWPDASAARSLEALGHSLAQSCGGKPVPVAKLHLTLAFLGDIAVDRVEEAVAAGASIEATPFDIAFDTIGWFRGARVAWAGCADPAPGLLALQRGLDEALRLRRFLLDDRPYTPHLTLARKVSRPVTAASIEPIGWRARELRLMRSETGTGSYATVTSRELGSG